ncbi:hypothetical protein PG913_08115 [Tenacibaculum pacificus]|uniref:hypothetical protein n=1 Tax=Tenacibaculum pacificus TaxID=3018314 RepID=UPI0022F39818|nr:hypothetical protein [Tenacibaculum pacificus]WBX72868.1 hypothetical protein PG913_08115 [Tenacibaculum pacificus]
MKTVKTDIKVLSQTDSVRLYVIEHTLHIETLISEAIGSLLGVEYEKSKSFGFGSTALSFSQKVQIIQDIKGLESEMTKKLTCLMNIRNKFAHVQEVDSFEKLFEIAKNGTQIKNQLEKWNNLDDKNDEDDTHKFLFFKLAEEITKMLWELQVTERSTKAVLQAESDFQKSQLESFKEIMAESENPAQINEEVLSRTIKKVPHLRVERKK